MANSLVRHSGPGVWSGTLSENTHGWKCLATENGEAMITKTNGIYYAFPCFQCYNSGCSS